MCNTTKHVQMISHVQARLSQVQVVRGVKPAVTAWAVYSRLMAYCLASSAPKRCVKLASQPCDLVLASPVLATIVLPLLL